MSSDDVGVSFDVLLCSYSIYTTDVGREKHVSRRYFNLALFALVRVSFLITKESLYLMLDAYISFFVTSALRKWLKYDINVFFLF